MVSRQGSWALPGRARPSVATAANNDEAHDAQKALSFWVSEARKLPENQRAFFLDGNQAESYSDYVEVLKDAVQQKADTSLVTRFSKKLLPVYHLANSIAPIATSASQLNPMPASLVLGGITCILSVTVSFDQYQSKILDTLEYMVDAVNNVNLYREKKMFDSDAGVKTCEIRLATDILEFGVTVAKMFYDKEGKNKNSLRTALKMQGSPFEARLSDIKTKFEVHLRALEAQRQIVRSDWAKSTNEGVTQLLESDYREKERSTEAEALRRNKEDNKERQNKQRQFLEWLPSIDFSGAQEDHFERRVEGSGSWLIEHEMFKSWRESSPSTLLWVYGKPGAGKSHLAAKAIDELSHGPSETSSSALAYVYCSSTSSTKGINFDKILASILAQLCRQLPPSEDFNHLIPRQDYGEGSGPTRREMRNGVAQALSKFQTSHVIIDGLDECHDWENDHFKEFCGFIRELTTPLSRSTRVLVLSRPSYAEIDRIVADFPRIQVDDGANQPDLENYIAQKVDEVLRDPSEDERCEFRGIKEQLLKNSAGTFLWPDRKLSHLKEIGSIEDMSKAMENATEGLEDLYRQDIQRILTKSSRFIRERAMNALLWVTNSREPLSKAELMEALSVKRGQKEITVRQRLSTSIPLCTECADLIVEKDGAFHLYHPSLRDFLVAEFQSIPGYDVLQRRADEQLAEVCLTYLNFDIFGTTHVKSEKELKGVQKRYPLLQYASRNWGHHFSIASENRDGGILIQQLLQNFLQTEAAMSLSLQAIFPGISFPYLSQTPGEPTALHIFAAHNLTNLAKSLADSEHLIASLDRVLFRPIHYATIGENREMAMWLLDCYDTHLQRNKLIRHLLPDYEFSLLHMFADYDWDEGISLLLSFGCDCNAVAYFGRTPLHHAAFFGATRAVEVLLNAGADPTAVNDMGNTPLVNAVVSKNVEIVTKLASAVLATHKGFKDRPLADYQRPQSDASKALRNKHAKQKNSIIDNALLSACVFANSEVVAVLLDHGANIKAVDSAASNGLHLAAEQGHTEILRTLLARCSESIFINARNYRDVTPLFSALCNQHSASAKVLLQHGAQPTQFFKELSPLCSAISEGCYEVAELLMTVYGVDAVEVDLDAASRVGWLRIFELLSPSSKLSLVGSGAQLLYNAALEGQKSIFYKLIDAIPDLDIYSPASHGRTVLDAAAFSGAADLVKWLLEKRPSAAFVGDRELELPIHAASISGSLLCVELLSTPETIDAESSAGMTPLMLACQWGQLSTVQYLVQNGANADKRNRVTGETPLTISLKEWHTKVAEYLIDFGADCTTADIRQDTPLHSAAYIGDISLVEKLLERGSEMSIQTSNGYTPLMVAVRHGRLEVVDLLLARDPIASKVRGVEGTTCIHFAAGGASIQLLELVLKASPELVLEVDEDGLDAMCWAARSGRSEAIMVLANHGLSINGAPKSLNTPLDIAIASGSTDVARQLIKLGADVEIDRVADDNYDQRTSLIIAAADGQIQTAEFLLKHGADPYLRDVFGLCAADYFMMNGWTEGFPQLHLSDYKPLDRSAQLAILQHTIVDISEQVISKKWSQINGAKKNVVSLLDTLMYALLLFQSKTSLTYLHRALAALPHDETFTLDCSFCYRGLKLQLESFFICPTYYAKQPLCSWCHESYLQSATEAGSLPVHNLLLKELELAAFRVFRVMETFKHDDGRNISTCLRSITLAKDWIDAILSMYKRLTSDENLPGQRLLDILPGYTYGFVSLLDTIREFQWSPPSGEISLLNPQSQDSDAAFVRRKLNGIYDGFQPNYSPAPLLYHGHRYIRIDYERSGTSKDLDNNKELRPSLYEDVNAYFANVTLDEIGDLIADDPLPVRNNRQEADGDRMRKALGLIDVDALPRFLSNSIRDSLEDRSLEELWETLEPLYEKREALGDSTAEVQVVDKEIQVYEVAWRMVRAMLDVPFERTVWEEVHHRQKKVRYATRVSPA